MKFICGQGSQLFNKIMCVLFQQQLRMGTTTAQKNRYENDLYNGPRDSYEGQTRDGVSDGKGRLSTFDGWKYEGDWKLGKKHGHGIWHFPNGNIRYQGGYRDGIWQGQGTSYYESGNKDYEGEWKNGKRHGKGIDYYESGTIAYKGEWNDGKRHGQGISYFEDESIQFEGEFRNNEQVIEFRQ